MRDSLAEVEAQTAFVGLLVRPLVTPASDPDLHRLARRHQRTLSAWAAKCGYRLVTVGDAVRLHRTPIGGEVARPAVGRPPSRRELVLTLVAAAACEDGEATTTIQVVSDDVRALTAAAGSGVTSYDPDRRAERVLLVRALDRLERVGALRPRTHDETMVRRWEDDGDGIGRGYEVNRAALLQLVDPAIVAAFADGAGDAVGTGTRLLRRLIETQAVLVAELEPAEDEWLQTRRGRLAEDAARMTGGVVEMRAEGLALILPAEGSLSAPATVAWPRATASSWVALLLLDAAVADSRAAGRIDDHGVAHVPSGRVDALAAQLHAERRRHLTKDMRNDPALVRAVAEDVLTDVGVLRLAGDEGWVLLPTAARYRDPEVVVSSGAGGGAT